MIFFFFFSSRRRHTRCLSDWSSDVCSSDLRCAIPQFSPEFTPLPFLHRTTWIAWILCDIPEARNHAITLYNQFLRHIETDTARRGCHHHFFGCSART